MLKKNPEMGFHCEAQVDLEFRSLLLLPSKCWDYRLEPCLKDQELEASLGYKNSFHNGLDYIVRPLSTLLSTFPPNWMPPGNVLMEWLWLYLLWLQWCSLANVKPLVFVHHLRSWHLGNDCEPVVFGGNHPWHHVHSYTFSPDLGAWASALLYFLPGFFFPSAEQCWTLCSDCSECWPLWVVTFTVLGSAKSSL